MQNIRIGSLQFFAEDPVVSQPQKIQFHLVCLIHPADRFEGRVFDAVGKLSAHDLNDQPVEIFRTAADDDLIGTH